MNIILALTIAVLPYVVAHYYFSRNLKHASLFGAASYGAAFLLNVIAYTLFGEAGSGIPFASFIFIVLPAYLVNRYWEKISIKQQWPMVILAFILYRVLFFLLSLSLSRGTGMFGSVG